jgi:hypothetical protein
MQKDAIGPTTRDISEEICSFEDLWRNQLNRIKEKVEDEQASKDVPLAWAGNIKVDERGQFCRISKARADAGRMEILEGIAGSTKLHVLLWFPICRPLRPRGLTI